MTDITLKSAVFHWRERSGDRVKFTALDGTYGEAEAAARELGWPGHAGTRWDYFKDDLRALRTKLSNLASLRIRDIF